MHLKATVCFPKYGQKIDGVYHVYTKFLHSNTYHFIKLLGNMKEGSLPIINLTRTNRFTNKKHSKKAQTFFVRKWVTIFFYKSSKFHALPTTRFPWNFASWPCIHSGRNYIWNFRLPASTTFHHICVIDVASEKI